MSVNVNPGPKPPPRQRIAAKVVHFALLRVRQHLVGRRHFLEAFLRRRITVDVGMQLPGEPSIRPLDFFRRRVLIDAERRVVVGGH